MSSPIHGYAFTCVCVFVCVIIHIQICIFTYTHIHIYTYTHTYTHIYIYAYTYIYIFTYTPVFSCGQTYRGTTRLGQQVPPQDDTTYQIASISKTFTSTMLYQLRDRGKLPQGLDTPVHTLIPEFKVTLPPPHTHAHT